MTGQVISRFFEAKSQVICSGPVAKNPSAPGLKQAHPGTHVEVLNMEKLSSHLIIEADNVGPELILATRRLSSYMKLILLTESEARSQRHCDHATKET